MKKKSKFKAGDKVKTKQGFFGGPGLPDFITGEVLEVKENELEISWTCVQSVKAQRDLKVGDKVKYRYNPEITGTVVELKSQKVLVEFNAVVPMRFQFENTIEHAETPIERMKRQYERV